ncbi:Aste57867_21223 [Aphanomyces stellatus]|uniref:Aste57867_21223 protein n=1 Tax=Aphanomyces stellatus TaxID=120398 RepID=A0A485LH10_9STRA|nr:hypothetical protein As57867_021155 [Aphanomyces stellatus]VFT97895.1 Aste57867_21223 [Aphanomyces stellatus]
MSRHYGAIAFAAALLFGTSTTHTSKFVYGIRSQGLEGTPKTFEKPLMQTLFMFVGMALALIVHAIKQRLLPKDERVPFNLKACFKLCIPAIADLIATALGSVALLYVNVSFFQLARCTIIIYVATLKVIFLHFTMTGYMRFGIFIQSVSIALISASCIASADNITNTLIGVSVLLLACLTSAMQYVLEEMFMKNTSTKQLSTEVPNPPLIVIGMEGIWGTLLMVLVVLPIAYAIPGSDNGRVEDFFDSIEMMVNSSTLCYYCLLFVISITGFNVASIYVTYFLDSVWRSILVNFRPVAVWVTSLMFYYVFTNGTYGESWTHWSWMQLGGMLLLFFGTAVYNANLKLSCFTYPKPEIKANSKDDLEQTDAVSDESESDHDSKPAVAPTVVVR